MSTLGFHARHVVGAKEVFLVGLISYSLANHFGHVAQELILNTPLQDRVKYN